ncbi:MAG: branched chain amino acid aminotransferase, partial [Caldimicrobium sp.]
MKIEINLASPEKRQVPDLKNLVFGKVFTPHMFLMNYDCAKGWHSPRIVPFSPIELHPAAVVLHYAQTIFEGLK